MNINNGIDSFMLCLDISRYNDTVVLDMWINLLLKNISGKIYVFQCIEVDKKTRERYENHNVVWVSNRPNTFKAIREELDALTVNDVFIIWGGESLLISDEKKSYINKDFHGISTGIHFQEDEKWEDFAEEIDNIYGTYQNTVSGIITICNVTNPSHIRICNLLESSDNLSICSTDDNLEGGSSTEIQEKFDGLIREIKDKSLKEALSMIQSEKETLPEEYLLTLEAIAHYSNGDIDTAISKLETVYEALTFDSRIFLARLYFQMNKKEKAIQVFEDVYSHNKRNKGLHELGAALFAKDDDKLLDILQEGLSIWPDNRVLICDYANLLAKQHNHKEAAKMFRTLNTPYYELVARVNDLLAANQTDLRIFNSYIFEIVDKYPELKNDAVDKVSRFAIENNKFFDAWKILNDMDISFHDEVTSRLIQRKIEILSDIEKACKALGKIKPFRKERDLDVIQNKRVELLKDIINYYSYEQNGYFKWRSYMECQTEEIWSAALKESVIDCLSAIASLDIDKALNSSMINTFYGDNKPTCLCIAGLRSFRDGYSKLDEGISVKEFMDNGWTAQEVGGTTIEKIWYRYYCSIVSTLQSENSQKAIEYALSIFDIGNNENAKDSELKSALFLMAWGNIQYRLGNTSEGIICVVEAIGKLISINEFTPVVEEGLSVMARFIGNDIKIKGQTQREKIIESSTKLRKYNDSFYSILCSLGNEEEKKLMIEELASKVESVEEIDINWVITLGNLISLLATNDRVEEAVGYIKKYYDEAEKHLDMRKDIAPLLLHYWGSILIKSGNLENLELAFDILDEALVRCNERNTVHHQEERASLSSEREKIIREYACYCGLYYSCADLNKEKKEKCKKKLLELASKCIPISIIEQKYYNQNCFVSDDLKQKNNRLANLKEEYADLCKNNKIDCETVQSVAAEIKTITDELLEAHPYYRSLDDFNGTDWTQLMSVLDENEVVYQYILTEMAVISILVTNRWIDVRCRGFDPNHDLPYEVMKKYIDVVENAHVNDKSVIECSGLISSLIAEHLCDYVWTQKVSNIYVIPDISKSRFPLSAVQYKTEYLIDRVDSITNFIDYKQLIMSLKERRTSKIRIMNKVFGKKEDPSINYIVKNFSVDNSEFINNDLSCSDSLESIGKAYSEGFNTLAIYGHGVGNLGNMGVDGAQCVQGSKKTIHIRDILEHYDFKNLILISCLGGSPNSGNPETSHGTWSDVFEKVQGNILTCIWSVPTTETVELMNYVYENLLNKGMSFSVALLQAQKECKKKNKNQFCWAGVEYWLN